MSLFDKTSRRDMERIARAMAELREIQDNDLEVMGREFARAIHAAHGRYEADRRRLIAQLDHIQGLAVTVARDGGNLPVNLSSRERREEVDKARKALEFVIDEGESRRATARAAAELVRKQASCEHEWESGKIDGPEGEVTRVACIMCGKGAPPEVVARFSKQDAETEDMAVTA